MGDGVHTKILLIIAGKGDTHTSMNRVHDVHLENVQMFICGLNIVSDVHLDAEQCVRCSSGGAPPRRSDS